MELTWTLSSIDLAWTLENDMVSLIKFVYRPRFRFDKPGFSEKPRFMLEKLDFSGENLVYLIVVILAFQNLR